VLYSDGIYSDQYLLERLSQDDQAAFETLYERYFAKLFNYAFGKTGDRFLAQEAVQELFIQMWQQRGRLVLTRSLNAYLFTSAKHIIIDQYRRETVRTHHSNIYIDKQTLVSNHTEEQVQIDELQQTYECLLNQLPDKCRHIFTLSRQGYSNREIARQEGISEKTVEQHNTKALRLLRENLPEYLMLLVLFSFVS
jgi:RNA polymerase sigma-70 factor (family 1)